MSKKEKLVTVKNVMSTTDLILRDITEKCLTFLGNEPKGQQGEDRDMYIRPLARHLVDQGVTSHRDAINALIKAAQSVADVDAGMGHVRRVLGKLLKAATHELYFRIKVVEGKQESWWVQQGQGDVCIGEIETYNVIPWEKEPYTVADFYGAVETLNTDIQTYNEAIINLLGWGDGDDNSSWAIPYLHAVVDTEENMALPPVDREYRPIFNLSEAFMELDRIQERKKASQRASALDMLNALTA